MDNVVTHRLSSRGIDPIDLFGQQDIRLRAIESEFDAKIVVRGEEIIVTGEDDVVQQITVVLRELMRAVKHGQIQEISDIIRASRSVKDYPTGRSISWMAKSKIGVTSAIVSVPTEKLAEGTYKKVFANSLPKDVTVQKKEEITISGFKGIRARLQWNNQSIAGRFEVVQAGNRMVQLKMVRKSAKILERPSQQNFFNSAVIGPVGQKP